MESKDKDVLSMTRSTIIKIHVGVVVFMAAGLTVALFFLARQQKKSGLVVMQPSD